MSRLSLPSPLVLIVALTMLAAGLLTSPDAQAGGPTLTVDTTLDDPALTLCSGAANDCSLRGAITTANTSPTQNTIQLTQATYVLDEVGAGENLNQTGDLDILEPIILDGNGATINANALDRVLDIDILNAESVTLNAVTMTGGNDTSVSEGGGGIRMQDGQLTLDGATVTNNTTAAIGIVGGGIRASGDADTDILFSTISFNTATSEFGSYGGGLGKPDGDGSIEVHNSVFDNNTAGSAGGGLYIGLSPGGAAIHDTDITNNTSNTDCGGPGNCGSGGGGVYAGAQAISFFNGSVLNNHAPMGSAGGAYVPEIHVSGTIFSGNTAANHGGAIYSFSEDSQIVNAVISNNQAGLGGGMVFGGELSHSTVAGNQATGDGGGVFSDGSVAITHSTIVGNTAAGEGGGVLVGGNAPTVLNSTISFNTAATGGGIARSGLIGVSLSPGAQPQGNDPPPFGPLTITHTTFANNTAASGANIKPLASVGDTVIRASIIADPVGGPNCSGALLSDGYNVEDADSCGLTGFQDIVNADPLLQPLAGNGGPTQTHALAEGSPAIDLVITCPPPSTDQTDDLRPHGNACDAGAFESDFAAPTPTASPTGTPTPGPSITPTPGPGRLWGDVDCSGDADAFDAVAELTDEAGVPEAFGADCPVLGDPIFVDGIQRIWGDNDCSGARNVLDALAVILAKADLPYEFTAGCPPIGTSVELTTI